MFPVQTSGSVHPVITLMGSLAADQANKCAQLSTEPCLNWQQPSVILRCQYLFPQIGSKKDNKDERYSRWEIAISFVSITGVDSTMEKQQVLLSVGDT